MIWGSFHGQEIELNWKQDNPNQHLSHVDTNKVRAQSDIKGLSLTVVCTEKWNETKDHKERANLKLDT